jgi:hypothetical protein
MTRLERFKIWVWDACHALSPALEHQLKCRFSKSYWANWTERTRQVVACPDNKFIPRVKDAGRIIGGMQIMHNGLKVRIGSYYGKESVKLFQRNLGVHEPQEERVFQEVLKQVPSSSVIIELGAYWSFYSMWFCSVVPGAKAFMVEPSAENMARGEDNFSLNGLRGCFIHGWVSASSGVATDGAPIVCVDDLVMTHALEEIAILHSDIQGSELDMLKGSEKILGRQKVSYTFISTHSEELHLACDQFLRERSYLLVSSIRPAESYSMDGILVHRAPHTPAIPPIVLSRKPVS